MQSVVDFLTQKWDYAPEVCLAAFALFHAARVSKESPKIDVLS